MVVVEFKQYICGGGDDGGGGGGGGADDIIDKPIKPDNNLFVRLK